jgi:tRNA G46 methylase TrmB
VKLWLADLRAAGLKLENSQWCRRARLVAPQTVQEKPASASTPTEPNNVNNNIKDDVDEDIGDDAEEKNNEDPDAETKVAEEKPTGEPKMRLHDIRHEVIIGHLMKLLKDVPNPVIVELGCNNGTLSKKMADAFPTAKFILVDAIPYVLRNKPLMKAAKYKGTASNYSS